MTRTKQVYWAGGLFDLKDLIGNRMPVVLLRTDFNFLLFCKLTMTTDLSFFRCQDRLCHSDDAFWKKWGKNGAKPPFLSIKMAERVCISRRLPNLAQKIVNSLFPPQKIYFMAQKHPYFFKKNGELLGHFPSQMGKKWGRNGEVFWSCISASDSEQITAINLFEPPDINTISWKCLFSRSKIVWRKKKRERAYPVRSHAPDRGISFDMEVNLI